MSLGRQGQERDEEPKRWRERWWFWLLLGVLLGGGCSGCAKDGQPKPSMETLGHEHVAAVGVEFEE
jgi:hypothetical protein